MKKITLFIPFLDGGGTEKVAIFLSQEFAKQGYAIDLLCIQENQQIKQALQSQYLIKIHSFNVNRVFSALKPLIKYLKNNDCDYFLSFMTEANLVAAMACLFSRSKVKLFWSEHSTYTMAEIQMPALHRYIYPPLVKILSKRVTKLIGVSAGVVNDFKKRHKLSDSFFSVIHNPVINQDILKKINAPIPIDLESLVKEPYLISVGRLTAAKDYPTLIHAMALVREHTSIKLLIVGDGELKDSLVLLIKKLGLQDTVFLLGYQSNPYPLIKKAKLFIMSSAWEGFGLVLVEALACNTPVISTDCPTGPTEILENGKWGKLIPVGDSHIMAQSILKELDNDKSTKNLSIRSRDFTVELIANQYISLITSD